MTADPVSGTALAWNVIGLPSSVSDGTDTARRVYAADGTLLAVYSGTTGTEGRVRIGNFDILSSSSGALTLESATWEGGRLLPGTGNDKILYHITDHLGSVRVVKDGTGAVLQRFDYYPFGSVSGSWSSSTDPSQPTLRYRFSGKEIAGQNVDASLVASALAGTPAAAAGTPYLDFGARLYDPRSAAWLSQDPLAEKYYGISPYAYCYNNPILFIDLNGQDGYVSNNGEYHWFEEETNASFYDDSQVQWIRVTGNKKNWDDAIIIREANIEALVSLSYDRDEVSKDVQLYSGDSPLFTKESHLNNAESYIQNWDEALNSATGKKDAFISGEIGDSGFQLKFYFDKGDIENACSLGLVHTGKLRHYLEAALEMIERTVFTKADEDPLYDMHVNNAESFLEWKR